MFTVLKNFGNNLGVYIPKDFIKILGLELNEQLKITIKNNQIVIEKVKFHEEKALFLNAEKVFCLSESQLSSEKKDGKFFYPSTLQKQIQKKACKLFYPFISQKNEMKENDKKNYEL